MKKLTVAVASVAFAAFAQEPAPVAEPVQAAEPAPVPAEVVAAPAPAPAEAVAAPTPAAAPQAEADSEEEETSPSSLFWGFGSTGIYSGYQLYGNLLNSEPTWQTYAEGNMNLPFDIGSVGIGFWMNSDLTDKRRGLYGKWFNEQDYNIHFDRTFWFNDDKTWGLAYRTEVVWYYYPHHRGHHPGNRAGGRTHFQSSVSTMTTTDWNHYFELVNPYVNPYFKWVREYHENNANLFLGGLKKKIALNDSGTVSITPQFELVWRSKRYNWCFPTAGWSELHGSGMATSRLGFDANWQFAKNFGLFAKVYWCHTIDHDLRHAAETGYGNDYGQYKDFAWGGVGVTWNF